jgi:hypothetical protein
LYLESTTKEDSTMRKTILTASTVATFKALARFNPAKPFRTVLRTRNVSVSWDFDTMEKAIEYLAQQIERCGGCAPFGEHKGKEYVDCFESFVQTDNDEFLSVEDLGLAYRHSGGRRFQVCMTPAEHAARVGKVSTYLVSRKARNAGNLGTLEIQAYNNGYGNDGSLYSDGKGRGFGIVVCWDGGFEYYRESDFNTGNYEPLTREEALQIAAAPIVPNAEPAVASKEELAAMWNAGDKENAARAYVESHFAQYYNSKPVFISAVKTPSDGHGEVDAMDITFRFESDRETKTQIMTVWLEDVGNGPFLYGEW